MPAMHFVFAARLLIQMHLLYLKVTEFWHSWVDNKSLMCLCLMQAMLIQPKVGYLAPGQTSSRHTHLVFLVMLDLHKVVK